MGILPAEELALRKALYASLVQESSKSNTETSPVKKIKLEKDTAEPSGINIICLSSPDLSEDDSNGSKIPGKNSQPVSSCPSSPQSSNSMHLCLSSSSWASASSDSSNSSCDSLFSPWSPLAKKKMTKKRLSKSKAKEGKLVLPKGLLDFGGKHELGSVKFKSGGDREKKPDVIPAKSTGVKQQTARKSASQVDVGKDDGLKDAPYQAQRKFAANHIPPPIR